MKIFEDEFIEAGRKFVKLSALCSRPPEIDVGQTPAEVVFEYNKMRLLRYRPLTKRKFQEPLLIVYANINKPYILDLQPDRSVVRRLLEGGLDIYMIDWGEATDADAYITIDDYVNWYMRPAVEHIRKETGNEKISVMGYCVGGFLATIYTALYPDKVKNLIIMAAPINFGTDKGLLHILTKYFDPRKIVEAYNNCPAEFLNIGFFLLNPLDNSFMKYVHFMERIDNEQFVKNFLRMEKWLNDGISVPGRFYEEYITKGYQQNLLIKNEWVIGNRLVDLRKIDMPLLVIIAKNDDLTPPDCTTPLIDAVSSKDKRILENPSGHIGVSVGSAAHKYLWPQVVDWLRKRSNKAKGANARKRLR